MNPQTHPLRLARTILTLLALALLLPGAARAQTTYKIQPILKVGDTVGGFSIATGYQFYVGPLNDLGQLALGAGTTTGSKPELLLQYADGQLTTIGGPGLVAPGGSFPADVTFDWPFGMNQLGNLVFVGTHKSGSNPFGTFLWDNPAKKLTAVALTGMPAVNNLTFQTGGDFSPAINNFGDIVFPAKVLNTAGKPALGLFFLGRDGKLLPIVLPDQQLPGGQTLANAPSGMLPSINDAGTVAFLAVSKGSSVASAYLWEQGSLSPLATLGMDAPGGGQFKAIAGAWVNNPSRSVLLAASLKGASGPFGLYRFAGGTITPLVVPGQEMPGGGQYKELFSGSMSYYGVSGANDAGQHAFEAVLADGSQGAYQVDADGKLSLILKSGANTELGPFTGFGRAGSSSNSTGISLNNRGQVALAVKIAGGPDTVVLLTPAGP
jgi:hypothetical protein